MKRVDGWTSISTDKLLPGDHIRLRGAKGDEGIIPCDCLLVSVCKAFGGRQSCNECARPGLRAREMG